MLNNKRGHNASKKGFIRTRKSVPKAPSVNSLKKLNLFLNGKLDSPKKKK